jgi:hypothetical protein
VSRARKAWLFAIAYKCTYLFLIVANLALFYMHLGFGREPSPLFAVAFLVANLASWLAFLSGTFWGDLPEKALSIGRIVGILLCATIIVGDLTAWMSPVSASVWIPLLEVSLGQISWKKRNRLVVWWVGCALLLALECVYFCCLRLATSTEGANAT